MQKKTIFFVGIALCLMVAAAWGYYWYQKPRTSLKNVAPDYTITAGDLYNAFVQNERQANSQYNGKVIAVTGMVQTVQTTDSTTSILLASDDDMGGINCSLAKPAAPQTLPEKGQSIQIKGRCTGFLMDVNLVDAVINH